MISKRSPFVPLIAIPFLSCNVLALECPPNSDRIFVYRSVDNKKQIQLCLESSDAAKDLREYMQKVKSPRGYAENIKQQLTSARAAYMRGMGKIPQDLRESIMREGEECYEKIGFAVSTVKANCYSEGASSMLNKINQLSSLAGDARDKKLEQLGLKRILQPHCHTSEDDCYRKKIEIIKKGLQEASLDFLKSGLHALKTEAAIRQCIIRERNGDSNISLQNAAQNCTYDQKETIKKSCSQGQFIFAIKGSPCHEVSRFSLKLDDGPTVLKSKADAAAAAAISQPAKGNKGKDETSNGQPGHGGVNPNLATTGGAQSRPVVTPSPGKTGDAQYRPGVKTGGDPNGRGDQNKGTKDDAPCLKTDPKCDDGVSENGAEGANPILCAEKEQILGGCTEEQYAENHIQMFSNDPDFFWRQENVCQNELFQEIKKQDNRPEKYKETEYAKFRAGEKNSYLAHVLPKELANAFEQSFQITKQKKLFNANNSVACRYLVANKPVKEKMAIYQAIGRMLNIERSNIPTGELMRSVNRVLASDLSKDLGLYSLQIRAIALLNLKAEENPDTFNPEKSVDDLTTLVLSCDGIQKETKEQFKKDLLIQAKKIKEKLIGEKVVVNGQTLNLQQALFWRRKMMNESIRNNSKEVKTHSDNISLFMEMGKKLSCEKQNSHSLIHVRQAGSANATTDTPILANLKELGGLYQQELENKNFDKNNPCELIRFGYQAAVKKMDEIFVKNPLLGIPIPKESVPDERCSRIQQNIALNIYDMWQFTSLGLKRYFFQTQGEVCKRQKTLVDEINGPTSDQDKDLLISRTKIRIYNEESAYMKSMCTQLNEEGKRAVGIPEILHGFLACEDKSEICRNSSQNYGMAMCELFKNHKTAEQTHQMYQTMAMAGIMGVGVLTGGVFTGVGGVAGAVIGALTVGSTIGSMAFNQAMRDEEVKQGKATKADCLVGIGGNSLNKCLAAIEQACDTLKDCHSERQYYAMQALESLGFLAGFSEMAEASKILDEANQLRRQAKKLSGILGKESEIESLMLRAEQIEKDFLVAKAAKERSKLQEQIEKIMRSASKQTDPKKLEALLYKADQLKLGLLEDVTEIEKLERAYQEAATSPRRQKIALLIDQALNEPDPVKLRAILAQHHDEVQLLRQDMQRLNQGKMPASGTIPTYAQRLNDAKKGLDPIKDAEKIKAIEKQGLEYLDNIKRSARNSLQHFGVTDLTWIDKLHPDDLVALNALGLKTEQMELKAGKNTTIIGKLRRVMSRLKEKLVDSITKNPKCSKI